MTTDTVTKSTFEILTDRPTLIPTLAVAVCPGSSDALHLFKYIGAVELPKNIESAGEFYMFENPIAFRISIATDNRAVGHEIVAANLAEVVTFDGQVLVMDGRTLVGIYALNTEYQGS